MNYKSILIVTYGRSGSTLLQGLLNSIDDTIIRGENYDFCYGLYKSWQAINSTVDHYGNHTPASSPNNPWYGAENFDQHAFIAQAKSIVRTQLLPADASTDTVYGFKEIRYMNHLDDLEDYLQFLNRIFPQPAIIFNTRNISDVISSQWWQSKADVSTPLIEQATKLFANYCLNHSNTFLVKYEEIISDLDHIKQLFSFLGAPFSEHETLKVLNTVHSYGAKQSTLAQSRHISQETLSRQQESQTTPTIKGSLVLETKMADKRLKEGVIIILVIRDEALRLPWILEYYTQLNCAGFIVIDDGSTDGSLEIVRPRNDTIIYHVNNLKYDRGVAIFAEACFGHQAQASGKYLTRPFMPTAPRLLRSLRNHLFAALHNSSLTLRRHKAAAASSSSFARALNYE
ncbi:sulfotransferase [Candidatus Reidiella endopervernicosa]|uniref:Sulfotransferase n=1 Tax=Candidatus Reidiella endopervernicosa TaxID=2738883 RepID=A0A6N0HSW3_9GAMM|nr:sulfotransferase [Candidatus Reidiella endopervernicosa]QKQ25499.1 sulfotransferase [Candidatus Reidiella endopervernicosa]